MINLQYPHIKGANERERLQYIERYLYQFVEQLQFALDTIEGSGGTSSPVASQMPVRVIQSSPVAMMSLDGGLSDNQATFQAIKPLIIKSADIINAYYQEINRRLESIYVAQSDFGTFAEQTSQEIRETSTYTTQKFENVQVVISNLDTNIVSVRGDLQAVGEEVSYTQRDIKAINENIDAIDSYVAEIGGSVYDLDEEIKTVGETVGAIDSEVKNVKTGVQAVEQKAQTIEGNVQTIATDVETLDTSIADVDKSVQAVDKNLWDLDNKVKDAKEGIDSSLGKLSGDLGNLNSGVKDLKEDVEGDLEDIKGLLDDVAHTLVEVNANIKSGLLYYDENEIPVYGLEIGQRNSINGVEVFNKFARFTSDRLSFYDQNDTEVAYVSDYKLYIRNVEITSSYKIGGYIDTVTADGGVITKWVGRG